MENLIVEIIKVDETVLYGIWKNSNDKTISKDINSLSNEYHVVVSLPEKGVLPYFVLSKNYSKETKNFELLIGSTLEKAGLERHVLISGEYAKITIKPKLGFLWGVAIGEAKRFFYEKWLPASQYQGLNMEYEFHTEKSEGRHPTIDIIFAIKKND